jgi:hypothetical protein
VVEVALESVRAINRIIGMEHDKRLGDGPRHAVDPDKIFIDEKYLQVRE